jgi:hypothetical protein
MEPPMDTDERRYGEEPDGKVDAIGVHRRASAVASLSSRYVPAPEVTTE